MISVLLGQHDRDHALGHRGVGWVGGVVGQCPIVIIDFEHDCLAFGIERTEVVFFMRVVGLAEVVKYGDRLDDPVDCFWAERGNARRYHGHPT